MGLKVDVVLNDLYAVSHLLSWKIKKYWTAYWEIMIILFSWKQHQFFALLWFYNLIRCMIRLTILRKVIGLFIYYFVIWLVLKIKQFDLTCIDMLKRLEEVFGFRPHGGSKNIPD